MTEYDQNRAELIEAAALDDAPPTRMHLAVFSEVKLTADGGARPIHMLRTGTFTDSSGRAFTFEPKHIQSIVANYARRPNPPITESHDYGRALGRTTALWADATGENLYGMPKWNSQGQAMLADGVYDGYSCELDPDDDGGFVKIGGSLTNYPAVKGLSPVSLAAPDIDPPALPEAILHPTEDIPMPDIEKEAVAVEETPPPITFVAPTVDNPIFQQQMNTALAQMQAQYEAQAQRALDQAQLQFERWKSEQAAQTEIAAFTQHATTATLNRPYALPLDADRLGKFMASIGGEPRKEATALFEQILSAGLVSFETYGSEGAGEGDADPVQAYNDALAAEMKTNPRSVAIANLQRKQPAIVAAYNEARSKKGGR